MKQKMTNEILNQAKNLLFSFKFTRPKMFKQWEWY